MNDEDEKKEIKFWIENSNGTNQFVARCLVVDAFLKLNQESPDVKGCMARLAQVLPIGGSQFISHPSFMQEWGIEE